MPPGWKFDGKSSLRDNSRTLLRTSPIRRHSIANQNRQAENLARVRRTNRNTLIIVGAIIGLLCLCGGIGSIVGDDDADQPAPTSTTVAPTTTRSTTTTAPTPTTAVLESTAPPHESPTISVPTVPPATHAPEPSPVPPIAPFAEPERTPEPATVPPPPAPPAPEPEPTVAPPAPSSVYYKNCAAARAAGAAPLYAGEPGYRSGLDRDGDGIACE